MKLFSLSFLKMPKLHYGSRGGVYYKRKGRKVYVNRFGDQTELRVEVLKDVDEKLNIALDAWDEISRLPIIPPPILSNDAYDEDDNLTNYHKDLQTKFHNNENLKRRLCFEFNHALNVLKDTVDRYMKSYKSLWNKKTLFFNEKDYNKYKQLIKMGPLECKDYPFYDPYHPYNEEDKQDILQRKAEEEEWERILEERKQKEEEEKRRWKRMKR